MLDSPQGHLLAALLDRASEHRQTAAKSKQDRTEAAQQVCTHCMPLHLDTDCRLQREAEDQQGGAVLRRAAVERRRRRRRDSGHHASDNSSPPTPQRPRKRRKTAEHESTDLLHELVEQRHADSRSMVAFHTDVLAALDAETRAQRELTEAYIREQGQTRTAVSALLSK